MSGGGNLGIGGVAQAVDDFINALTNVSTLGQAGFERGKFKPGVVGEKVIDGVKEITGANAAEEANKDARERFEEEKKKVENKRQEQKAESAQEQILKSRLAGDAQAAQTTTDSTTTPARFSKFGSDEQDYLGI